MSSRPGRRPERYWRDCPREHYSPIDGVPRGGGEDRCCRPAPLVNQLGPEIDEMTIPSPKQVADNMEIPHTTMSCLKKVPPPRGVGGVQEPKSRKMSYSLRSPQWRGFPFFSGKLGWKATDQAQVSDNRSKVRYSLEKRKVPPGTQKTSTPRGGGWVNDMVVCGISILSATCTKTTKINPNRTHFFRTISSSQNLTYC